MTPPIEAETRETKSSSAEGIVAPPPSQTDPHPTIQDSLQALPALFRKYVNVWLFSIFLAAATSTSLALSSILHYGYRGLSALAMTVAGFAMTLIFVRLWGALRQMLHVAVIPQLADNNKPLAVVLDKFFDLLATATIGILFISVLSMAFEMLTIL